jgi:hypothetical protein
MISKLIEALESCAQKTELENSPFLAEVYALISDTQSIPSIVKLLSLGNKPPQSQPLEIPKKSDKVCDYRFKRLLVNGVRKFPFNRNCFYGLDFMVDEAPASSIYLGANGVGKSSLYVAMELATLHQSYSAVARGCMGQDQVRYFLHAGTGASQFAEVIIQTLNDEIYYPTKKRAVCSPAFFCSEYDIRRMENKDFDEEELDMQLGFDTMKHFIKRLEEFRILVGHLIEIQNNSDPDNTHRDEVIKMLGEGFNDEIFNISSETQTQIKKLIEALNEYYDHSLNEIRQNMDRIIPELLSSYLQTGEEQVEIGRTEKSVQLRIKIKSEDGEGWVAISPRIYLNTFRFKLYCVVLKIALACCAKLMSKNNFPIVVDDVFDSIDFNHRYKIHELIRKVVDKHNDLMPDDMPLQLIFLTQDSIVGENVWRGIKKASVSAKYSRIYNCNPNIEPLETDVTTQQISSPDIRFVKFIKLEDCILK